MKILVHTAAAGLLAMATPMTAHADPEARIREVAYAPDVVYPLTGAFRTATQIVFAPDEAVRHAAIGDSVSWEVAAEGSVLFLKPRERHQATNLLVVTERGGAVRHYVFHLSVRDPGDRDAVYQLRFRYPEDEQARGAAEILARTRAAEARLMTLQLQHGVVEGPRNLNYSVQGDPRLQPSEASDNGRFTVLRFPGAQPIPAIFEVDESGGERLAPYDVRGEFVVIHGLVRGLRLRRGQAVLCIFNDAFDALGRTSGGGTASPAVDRTDTAGPA